MTSFEQRQKRKVATENLPDDMEYVKAELVRLREHTGLSEPVDEEEDEEKA